MDTIREQLNKPLITGVIGLVVGAFIGLVILGWGVWPVKWVDASPAFLRDDVKQDYLRMAIDSYVINPDASVAIERWKALGDSAPDVLKEVYQNPMAVKVDRINNFAVAVQANVSAAPAAGVTPTSASATGSTSTTGSGTPLPVVLGVSCVLVLVVVAALAYVFLVRKGRVGGGTAAAPGTTAAAPQKSAESQIFSPTRQEPPVAQFMTTYMTGDDLYDDSFSIDSPSGEFLGECGVGISDIIGVGDPKKVTALEVWLFDKNDIQTVTKVLMSEHAFNDAGIRQRLESKGEPILTEPGKHILLETATLQLEARVVDMNYGQGAMPPCSFFDRLTLELAVWPKA
jgi:hypothetical protein